MPAILPFDPSPAAPSVARRFVRETIDAGGLTFQAPAAWKSTPPATVMRRAQLTIPAAPGDGEPAELVVTAFPGGAGSVPANVARWQQQFEDKDGKPPRITTEARKGKNVDAVPMKPGK